MKTESQMSTTPDLVKWKHIAKRPNAWFDDLFQLSFPAPWQVVATYRRIDLSSLRPYSLLLSMTIPLYMVAFSRKQQVLSKSVSLPILSTVSIFCVWKIASPLSKLITAMKETLASISYANPAAWECLSDRIEKGLAYRRRQFDVYLPPHMNDDDDDQQQHQQSDPKTSKAFILFLPGAFVEHVALSQPASLFADAGHVVVVVSAEPLKMVDDRFLRFRPNTIRTIQRMVEEKHGTPSEWVLAGHSMGSFLCTKLVSQLPNIRSIVMWGSAPFIDYVADLSETNVRVLIVQATNDAVIEAFASPELWQTFWSRIPSSTKTIHYIQGGTHSGFANYRSQWKPEVDGIPVDQQHREAVDVTLRFLEGAR